MQRLTVDTSFAPTDHSEIAQLETALNIRLPEYLGNFLLQYSGTSTVECDFALDDLFVTISYFLPVKENPVTSSIYNSMVNMRKIGWASQNMIPFAHCGAHTLFVELDSDCNSRVYFFAPGDDYEVPLKDFGFTFEDLINRLQVIHPEDHRIK